MNAGLANNIAHGQAQRDVSVDDRAEQQRPTTEIDCHGGPIPEVSGPPEATAPLARGGLPLQACRQRQLQPPSGTLSPPTVVISDSAFEKWLQSDNMEIPMFSQSEGPQQSAPTAVTLAAAAPAAEAVTDNRVFPAVSSKGVAEARQVQRLGGGRGCNIFVPVLGGNGTKIAPTGDRFDQTPWSNAMNLGQACRPCRGSHVVSSPEGAVLVTSPGTKSSYPRPPQSLNPSCPHRRRAWRWRRYLQQRRRPVVLFSPQRRWGGGQGARFCRWNSGIDGGPGNWRYGSLRSISWGGARVFSCSSGIGGNISGGTGDQR